MIERYETPEMAKAWLEDAKFQLWLKTELAVLDAKVKQGRLHPDVAAQIRRDGIVDLDEIAALERELEHDLLAFVRSVQGKLNPGVAGEFHRRAPGQLPELLQWPAPCGHCFFPFLASLKGWSRREIRDYYISMNPLAPAL